MASFSADCPHCNVVSASFILLGARNWPLPPLDLGQAQKPIDYKISVGGMCPKCSGPVAAVLVSQRQLPPPSIANHVGGLIASQFDLTADSFKLVDIWPKPPEPLEPKHLPPESAEAFREAEQNYRWKNKNAASVMYGKALETGLTWRFPQVKGMLNEKIGTLVTKGFLPRDIGDWAHQVRLIRKPAAHDATPLTEADMEAARDFADAVLRYVITLPIEVALRRKLAEDSILDLQPDVPAESGKGADSQS